MKSESWSQFKCIVESSSLFCSFGKHFHSNYRIFRRFTLLSQLCQHFHKLQSNKRSAFVIMLTDAKRRLLMLSHAIINAKSVAWNQHTFGKQEIAYKLTNFLRKSLSLLFDVLCSPTKNDLYNHLIVDSCRLI